MNTLARVSTRSKWVLTLVGALLMVAPLANAEAQDSANKHDRRGFWISVGAGVGSLGCDDCGGSRENGGTAQIALAERSLALSGDGTSAILGLGYDIRVGRNFSIAPFLNGAGESLDCSGANFNQVGVGLTRIEDEGRAQ